MDGMAIRNPLCMTALLLIAIGCTFETVGAGEPVGTVAAADVDTAWTSPIQSWNQNTIPEEVLKPEGSHVCILTKVKGLQRLRREAIFDGAESPRPRRQKHSQTNVDLDGSIGTNGGRWKRALLHDGRLLGACGVRALELA